MWSLESKGKLTLEVTEKLDRKLSTLLDVNTIYGDKGNQRSHQLQLLGGQSISIIDMFIKDAYKKKKRTNTARNWIFRSAVQGEK